MGYTKFKKTYLIFEMIKLISAYQSYVENVIIVHQFILIYNLRTISKGFHRINQLELKIFIKEFYMYLNMRYYSL